MNELNIQQKVKEQEEKDIAMMEKRIEETQNRIRFITDNITKAEETLDQMSHEKIAKQTTHYEMKEDMGRTSE